MRAGVLHLVRHRSSLKQRVHAVLLTHGKPCPVSDLFGVRGRQLLTRLGLPEPWQATIEASLRLIDELDREISECERELRRLGADHRYVPLLCTVPGISWVLAYTIAPMRIMGSLLAQNRAPSEIVQLYAAEDAKRGRNDPCTCGSGRKWKHCHGG